MAAAVVAWRHEAFRESSSLMPIRNAGIESAAASTSSMEGNPENPSAKTGRASCDFVSLKFGESIRKMTSWPVTGRTTASNLVRGGTLML